MANISVVAIIGMFFTSVLTAQPIKDEMDGEFGNHFEGDMILEEDQIEDLKSSPLGDRNGLISKNYRWPNKIVPYVLSGDHSKEQNDKIEDALRKIEAVSCIKFVRRTNERGYIQLINGKGCYSWVGYQGKKQDLSLQGNGCMSVGTIQHEFLHALGFYHMQSAYDRDDHVIINWENIEDDKKSNFNTYPSSKISHFNTAYDLDSVMHYSNKAFSKNGKETITPRDRVKAKDMGQRNGLSPTDILKLNTMYECKNDSNSGNGNGNGNGNANGNWNGNGNGNENGNGNNNGSGNSKGHGNWKGNGHGNRGGNGKGNGEALKKILGAALKKVLEKGIKNAMQNAHRN